jgi:ERCC4-type nuclease
MKILNSKPIFDIFTKRKPRIKKQEQKTKVLVDYREKNSLVGAELISLDLDVEFKELKIGDYIVKETIIERKTISDFLSSMINKRLVKQLEELQQYPNKLLIIEGLEEQDLYNDEKVGINGNAIRGFLLSIALKYKIPIIYSKDAKDTAKFISVLSKKQNKEMSLQGKKKTLDKKEQLQFIIESFPGVGPKKSKNLLEKFGSIQNIILAPTEELQKILGKQSEIVREIIERKYN